MVTEEKRTQILPVWAGLVSLIAIYFLTLNLWKALLIAVFVAGSAMLGYGARWVMMGSFASAVLAIAVALGLPPPDQWLQALTEVRETIFRFARVAM
jgi:uncharacterized membrane protein